MALNFFKIKKGLNTQPVAGSTVTQEGDIAANLTSHKLEYHNGTLADPILTESAPGTITGKDLSGNTASNLINGSGEFDFNSSGTITVPNATDTLVGKATTDTLTNKTLSGNTASNLINGSGEFDFNSSGTITVPNATDTLVARDTTDTLTNKTLSGNTATDLISGSGQFVFNTTGVMTAPNATDTLVGLATTDTLTNKTLTGNTAATLINGSGTLALNSSGTITLPNATDTLVGKATTDTLSNKTFSDAPIFTQISTPSSPGAGLEKLYPKTDGFFYSLNSAGIESKIGSGSGSGGINYILNPDAEANINGYSTYANTAGPTPIDGTGGSPVSTFARSTSNPLRGTGSFVFSKDANNRQGEGVSYDFTIDSADQAKMLTTGFNYQVDAPFIPSDGTAPSLSDIGIFIYDITNAVLVPVVPYNLTTLGPLSYSFSGQFQTASDSLDYRLIFHVATTNTASYDFKFDNVFIGPSAAVSSSIATTSSMFLSSGVSLSDSTLAVVPFDVIGFDTSGLADPGVNAAFIAPVAGYYQVNAAVEFDMNATGQRSISIFLNGTEYVSLANMSNPSAAFTTRVAGADVVKANAGDLIQIFAFQSSGSLLTIGGGGSLYTHASIALQENFEASFDNAVVAASYGIGSPQLVIPTATDRIITYRTKAFDTHSAYDTATSIYTVPVSGVYDVRASIEFTGPIVAYDHRVQVFVNGSLYRPLQIISDLTSVLQGSTLVRVNAGDEISFMAFQSSGSDQTLGASGDPFSYMSISKLSDAASLSSDATVGCSYNASTGIPIASGVFTAITYDTKDFDTHNAYDVTTGKYIIPVSGVYEVSGSIEIVNSGGSTNDHRFTLFKEGVLFRNLRAESASPASILTGSTSMFMLAGEELRLFGLQNTGSPQSMALSGPEFSYMSIMRLK